MLRKQISFDQCLKVDALSSAAIAAYDWVSSSSYAITMAANTQGGFNTVISLDGWMAYGLTAAWWSGVTLSTGVNPQAPASAATKLAIGVRIRSFSTYGSADDVVIFGATLASGQALLTYADVAPLRGSVPSGSPSDLYFEFVIDGASGNVDIWANGTFLKTKAGFLNAGNRGLVAAGGYQAFLRQAVWAGPVTINWYRDIYFVDDVPGDGLVGRLGPQRLIPIYIDQSSGGWVGDDGSTDLKATLNAPLPASAQVVSPTSKDPLVLSLAAAIPDGYKVTAVSLRMASRSVGDAPTNTKIEIKQGSATVTPPQITSPKTLSYAQNVAQMTLAPDGGLWDATKIDQTTIVLTPDQ